MPAQHQDTTKPTTILWAVQYEMLFAVQTGGIGRMVGQAGLHMSWCLAVSHGRP